MSNMGAADPVPRILERIWKWAPEIALLLISTAAGIWADGRWLDTTGDVGIWWSLAQRISHGEICYRDIFLQYGPVSPYLLSISGHLFGFSPTWFLLANWIPAIIAGLLLLRAGRPYLSTVELLSLVGLLVGFALFPPRVARLVLPYSPAAVQSLCFAIGALLLLPSRAKGLPWSFVAGALAGLALFDKQEVGVAAILGLSAALVLEGRQAVPWAVRCLVSLLIVSALGIAVILGSGASIDSLVRNNHLWPIAPVPREWRFLSRSVAGLAASNWREAILTSVSDLLKLMLLVSLAGLCLGREKSRKRWALTLAPLTFLIFLDLFRGRSMLPYFHPIGLSMTVSFVVALLAWLDRGVPGRGFLFGFGIFAGLVGLRTAFGWDTSGPYTGVAHFATNLTWLLLLFCLVPRWLPGGTDSANRARLIWLVVILPVACYWAAMGVDGLKEEGKVSVATRGGRIFTEQRFKTLYSRIQPELHPGERALFLPETSGLDVLFGVEDASPFLGHMPGWLDPHAEEVLIQRFEKRPPNVVIIFDRSAREFGVDKFGRGYGVELAAWINRRYSSVAILPGAVILRPRGTTTSLSMGVEGGSHARIRHLTGKTSDADMSLVSSDSLPYRAFDAGGRRSAMTARSHATVEAFERDAARNLGYLYTTNARLSSKLANRRLTEAALAATDFNDKRVLDVGCGDGTYTVDLFEEGHPRSIYGFDPAQEAVSVARQKISGRPIAFAAHDAYAVPLDSDSFDIAHLRGVLHHLDRPAEVLREALRLAPRLIVIEPNGYNLALKCVEKLSRYHREHGERSYAPSRLDRWVREVGGRVCARRFVGLVPFFCPDWLARALKSAERTIERAPVLNAACCAVYVQLVEREG